QAQKAPPRLPADPRADRAPEEPAAGIEYAGEARDLHAPRPVLRLTGSQPGHAQEAPMEAVPPTPTRPGRAPPQTGWRPPPEGEDRLPVTHNVPPVPPKQGARRLAAEPSEAIPAAVAVPAPHRAVAPTDDVDAMKLYSSSVDLLHHGQHAEAIA